MVKHTQTICRLLLTNCLSAFNHFVGLALKGLTNDYKQIFPHLVKILCILCASHKHFLQMDKWKVVSGHADGTICLWDSKSGVKYWQTYMKHPVRICHFNESLLTYINIPEDTSPQNSCWNADDLIQHRKYRGKTISKKVPSKLLWKQSISFFLSENCLEMNLADRLFSRECENSF